MPSSFNSENYPWKPSIDYRKNPECYLIGKGEQGVLICEPFKSEILPFWKFKTLSDAKKSSDIIYRLFLRYMRNNEFVGADLARKFLQMGFTRARRYANYKGGRKYDPTTKLQLKRGTGDKEKFESSIIFYKKWRQAENNIKYQKLKKQWKTLYG